MSTELLNHSEPHGSTETPAPRRRSGGPRTPEGKARSRMNALKHGAYAKLLVLRTEDEAAYHRFLELYYSRFAPTSEIERRLVSQLAAIDWRLARYINLETRAIDAKLDDLNQNPFSTEAADQLDLTILAVNSALEQRALAFASGREMSLVRTREVTLRTLQNLRRNHPSLDSTPSYLSPYTERTPELTDSIEEDMETN